MTTHNGLNGKANRKSDPAAGSPGAPPAFPSGPKQSAQDGASPDAPPKADAFRIKSYYARTVEEALVRAREEMGVDAVLVHSRKTPLESRHLGPYEVVFSYPGKTSCPEPDVRAWPGNGSRELSMAVGVSEATGKALSAELAHMRQQMEDIRRALVPHPASLAEHEGASPIQTMARERLLNAGLDAETADSVVTATSDELQELLHTTDGATPVSAAEVSRVALGAILGRDLARRTQFPPPVQRRDATADIVAFIGPPGAGKTTSLIKLALITSQASELPIHLISADCYRIGATEQIKTFASILGVSIDFADSPRSLAQAIEANRHKQRILIDMPGLSGSDFELLDDLASYMGSQSDICKHLVLPATMRLKDMKRSLAQYERFGANRLLFTHLDETDSFGPLYCATVWSGKPLSYLSAGQQIPEDFEEATEERVLGLLLGAEQDEAAA